MDARESLIGLSIKYRGDWNLMYDAIERHVLITDEQIERYKSSGTWCDKCITILDPEYPKFLKEMNKPPFVIFYKGDISLLSSLEREDAFTFTGYNSFMDEGQSSYSAIKYFVSKYKGTLILSEDECSVRAAVGNHMLRKEDSHKTILVTSGDFNNTEGDLISRYGEYATPIINANLIISEYPPLSVSGPDQEMSRDRIITCLAKTVNVIAADENTEHIIEQALLNGDDIKVLPMSWTSPFKNNQLIYDGAEVLVKENC